MKDVHKGSMIATGKISQLDYGRARVVAQKCNNGNGISTLHCKIQPNAK